MTEKSLEELADELLAEDAKRHGASLRELGVLDERRLRTVRGMEIPMSSVFTKHRTGVLKDDSFEEDE